MIVQAGSSEAGRQLAAETAEVVFGASSTLAAAQRFYADVKGHMEKLNRRRDHLKILPGAFVVIGDSVASSTRVRRCASISACHARRISFSEWRC